MAKLYFRFGLGKTSNLCQVAYNYKDERDMNVIVINAFNNEDLYSKLVVNNHALLMRSVNFYRDGRSFYDRLSKSIHDNDVKVVLVDNAEYLSEEEAYDLFLISKLENVPVICYGNRFINNMRSNGVLRLMSLADNIEKIDDALLIKRGTLDFNYGAMNCSKTASLLTRNQALKNYGCNTFLVKPKLDRTEEFITSRIGLKEKADLILGSNDIIYGHAEYLARDHVNYILVDEAQFLTEKQIDEFRSIVNDYNIPIICYGLKNDFLGNLFSGSRRLLELADNIYKMKTVCSCGAGANFNVRRDRNGNYLNSGEQILIDDGGNYDSECGVCFIKHVLKKDKTS